MSENKQIHMPGVFGGLMRYDEEYKSKFIVSPNHVLAFIIGIIILILGLKVFWPI